MIYISEIRTTAPEAIQNPTEKKVFATVDKLKTINNIVDSNVIVAGNPLIVN